MKKLWAGILALLLCISCIGCSSDDNVPNNNVSATSSEVSTSSEASSKEIYSDKLITMSFVKKYGIPETKGMLYFDVKVNNKSDKKITVYLQDAYMDDVQFQVGSGVPLDLLPGKNAVHTFTGKYEGTKIASVDKIKKIGFKIIVMGESSKTLETTKSVEIKF